MYTNTHTCSLTHDQNDRGEGQCWLTEISGEEKCLVFVFEGRVVSDVLGGDCSRKRCGYLPRVPLYSLLNTENGGKCQILSEYKVADVARVLFWKLLSLTQSHIRPERSGSAQKQTVALCSCHCEMLRTHLEIRCTTNLHAKVINIFIKTLFSFSFFLFLRSWGDYVYI